MLVLIKYNNVKELFYLKYILFIKFKINESSVFQKRKTKTIKNYLLKL